MVEKNLWIILINTRILKENKKRTSGTIYLLLIFFLRRDEEWNFCFFFFTWKDLIIQPVRIRQGQTFHRTTVWMQLALLSLSWWDDVKCAPSSTLFFCQISKWGGFLSWLIHLPCDIRRVPHCANVMPCWYMPNRQVKMKLDTSYVQSGQTFGA